MMSFGDRPSSSEHVVELRAVSKGYREGERRHEVLVDVDASILRGEIVVLVGRSGSGKSTLLNLVSGIDQPDGGDVLVEGRAINRMTERERTLFRRDRIGFIFQFFNLIPTLTVIENLLLPLELAGRGADDRDEAIALLDRVGLADRRSSYPDKLSGGEQQRVAVARALVNDPWLVLADEPTGNLDSKTGQEFLILLRHSCDELGQTIVIVTHDAKAASFADRVVFLMDGRIADHLQMTGDQAEDIRQIQRHLRALEV